MCYQYIHFYRHSLYKEKPTNKQWLEGKHADQLIKGRQGKMLSGAWYRMQDGQTKAQPSMQQDMRMTYCVSRQINVIKNSVEAVVK